MICLGKYGGFRQMERGTTSHSGRWENIGMGLSGEGGTNHQDWYAKLRDLNAFLTGSQ